VIIADKLHDTDPDNKSTATFIDAIGKAAGGSKKPLHDLGISIDEAAVTSQALHDSGKDNPAMLTDSEKAAARFKIIMDKLNPVLQDATTGSADLRDRQDELHAKFDNLSTKIGELLEGPLADLLTWLSDEVDAIKPAVSRSSPPERYRTSAQSAWRWKGSSGFSGSRPAIPARASASTAAVQLRRVRARTPPPGPSSGSRPATASGPAASATRWAARRWPSPCASRRSPSRTT
jgi:hypothetical protein